MDKQYEQFETKMQKSINALEKELNMIRAGRANPHILDRIFINYYGVQTPVNQVANITVPEARMIQIQPWDASVIKDIEKAILASNIGITPSNDGKVIRLVFPELTEERRKELTKEVKKKGEDAKVAIRNIRREALDHFRKAEKEGEISEDQLKEIEEDIQKMTDKYIEKIDVHIENKNKDILSI
jgi:ribosome recycling factor